MSDPSTQWGKRLIAGAMLLALTSCASAEQTQSVTVNPATGTGANPTRSRLAANAVTYLAEHPAPPQIGRWGSGYGVVTSVASHYGAIIAVTPAGFTVVEHDSNCDPTYGGEATNFDQVVEPGDVIVWLLGKDDLHGSTAVCVNEIHVLAYGAVHG